ncbi:GGDEF domain-containing protein [Marinomonas algarum]|uniref:diguanylate cyclase n=1 Tax=Marinomonas algarum TaxID=2883105 RepID=A0A9X1IQ00_9GAMM|nr:GGDEF domain-containing protein [Marinomonas algarum]MCB5162321.1 GGDEF domain-containing protein [Marinomonas algarum]
MRVLAEDIIVSWIERYAEKQVLYDKERTLSPLIQQVNLSEEFANLDSLKAWAKQPDDVQLKQKALADTEAFRGRFADDSYFIGLKGNNHYYYSDGVLPPSGDLYRYTLDSAKASDDWFYQIMAAKLDMHLNVNPDVELGVIKLWSDVLIRDGDAILGVVGTGLDLSVFLAQMVEKQDIYSAIVFTNYEGSIQLHKKQELIDYATITKQAQDKKLIFSLLDDIESRERLQNTFVLAKSHPNHVKTTAVYLNGVRQLASVVYIPEIDWFQTNFIDIDNFLPLTEFSGLLLIFFVSLVCALIVFYGLLTLIVTKPLEELSLSIQSLGEKRYRAPLLSCFAGPEIKRLVHQYETISRSLLEHQSSLEAKVEERTEALNRLAKLDPLTELYNRRGFELFMEEYMQNWHEKRQSFGLINVDVNRFKAINDHYGHAAGDRVLQSVAAHLLNLVGDQGEVARWGGDEFLILLKHATDHSVAQLTQQLSCHDDAPVLTIGDDDIKATFSVGSALIQENDTIDDVFHRADSAMYAMKFSIMPVSPLTSRQGI